MRNFVQPGDVVMVTALARGMTSGDLIVAATDLASARSDHADEGCRHFGGDGRGWLNGIAVVAGGP